MGAVARVGVLDTHIHTHTRTRSLTHLGAAQHNGSIVLPAARLLRCRGRGNVTLLPLKVNVLSEVKKAFIYILIHAHTHTVRLLPPVSKSTSSSSTLTT